MMANELVACSLAVLTVFGVPAPVDELDCIEMGVELEETLLAAALLLAIEEVEEAAEEDATAVEEAAEVVEEDAEEDETTAEEDEDTAAEEEDTAAEEEEDTAAAEEDEDTDAAVLEDEEAATWPYVRLVATQDWKLEGTTMLELMNGPHCWMLLSE